MPDSASSDQAPSRSGGMGDLLNLDLEQLSKLPVSGGVRDSQLATPSSQLSAAVAEAAEPTTTGEMLRQSPSVSARRISALNLDPSVRGYHASQLNAGANGITQLKTRVDIDSLFSQIDPGVIQDVTIIDGPYTSLYGPGFAFLQAELLPVPRFSRRLETHFSTEFVYGTNGQSLYNRDNVLSGGKGWGMCLSYGLRCANDYLAGGSQPSVPSSYQKWDGLCAVSFDLDPFSRIEFLYLHTELNNVELPGVVYDINNSTNNQFNVRYVAQSDRSGPEEFVLQSWWNQTYYNADASRLSKQETFYEQFFTLPTSYDHPVNTLGQGYLRSLGLRAVRTFGDTDTVQWTIGLDWRRYQQRYQEITVNEFGQVVYYGDVYGIPESQMDDVGALTNLVVPFSDDLTVNVGGRVDYCRAWQNSNDPVVTQFDDPSEYYYAPGFAQPSKTLGMAYAAAKQNLTEEYTLKAGTAFAMRMPTLTELYSDEPYSPVARFGNSYVDGSSSLSPERDLQFDLGLSFQEERLTYGARGFYAFIWDYILAVPVCIDPCAPNSIAASRVLGRNFSYFPWQWRSDLGTLNENSDTCGAGYQYVNLDLATLLGGELFAEVKPRDGFAVFGSMSYVRGTNESPMAFLMTDSWSASEGQVIRLGGSEGLPGIYPLAGTVGVRFFDPTADRWMIEFSSRMVARQDYVAVSLSEIHSPGFATFALRGYYRVRKNVRLTMNLQNLFDKDYAEPGSLAYVDRNGNITFVKEPGFTALFGVEARF